MCKKCAGAQPLDTLAQLPSTILQTVDNEQDIVLTESTKADNERAISNRAKRKFLSRELALGLVDVTKVKREKILEKIKIEGQTDQNLKDFNENEQAVKSYWNMFHCANELLREGDEVKGKYCKNRTCLICNSIRTAQNLNSYKPVLEAWKENMYMVTLTIPNCSGENLKSSIDGMFNTFTKIKNYLYQNWKRGKGVKFEGIRKLESTYNPIRKDYHPHFHILVHGKEAAENLLAQWMERTQHLGTKRSAQDIRKADENAALELFKYFTKVMTSTSKVDGERAIYLEAIDTIFKAVKGKRTFQPFGFKKADYIEDSEDLKEEENEPTEATDHTPETFVWNQELANWISTQTGEMLTKYKLSPSLQEIPKQMRLPKGYRATLFDLYLKGDYHLVT